MNESLPARLDLIVSDAADRDQQLSEAVDSLIPIAVERRHGILVTQHNSARYTLETSPSIPCGTIREQRRDRPGSQGRA